MSKLGPEGAGLVLERALADARREALEEAAKVCEAQLARPVAQCYQFDPYVEMVRECAAAIRALIPPEPRG